MIDDNGDHHELFRLAAETLRIKDEVLTVEFGPLTLELLDARAQRGELPSLLLVDLKIPGMDESSAVRRLHALPRFELVPVVMFSRSDDIAGVRRLPRPRRQLHAQAPRYPAVAEYARAIVCLLEGM